MDMDDVVISLCVGMLCFSSRLVICLVLPLQIDDRFISLYHVIRMKSRFGDWREHGLNSIHVGVVGH